LKIIGVTGGIGSGKSTVSRILRDLGAKIVSADKIARDVVYKGEKALEELIEYFGNDIINDEGELDRKKLGTIVFDNIEKLEVLNSITHKYIVEKIVDMAEQFRKESKSGIMVIDAPIPVEHGFIDLVDEVWVVTADIDVRIKRIIERDGITREEALNRINSQKKEGEYLGIADEVLVNNGGIEELEREVAKLFIKAQKSQGDIIA
jgi:dephospho-CoA kinase